MRLSHICFLGLIVGAILINAACTGQKSETYGVITGRITETDTTVYLSNVTVQDNIDASITDISDSAGFFRLEKISIEKHDVTFTKDGYEPYTLTFDYFGTLDRPVVTYVVPMRKIGEEIIPEETDSDTTSTE